MLEPNRFENNAWFKVTLIPFIPRFRGGVHKDFLRQNLLDHVPLHIGQSALHAVVFEGEALVVQTE